MTDIPYEMTTGEGRDGFIEICGRITTPAWPTFMLQDPVCNKYWGDLYHDFPEYQFILTEPGSDTIVACGNSIPILWESDFKELPDEGWDWALEKGIEDGRAGRSPNVLCALQIVVPEPFRKLGISTQAVRAMRQIGRTHNLETMIAPVRPNFKHRYPHTPMPRYLKWVDSKGIPKDPWLRVHALEGAEIVKVCPRSMRISGTIEEWERWTGMRFPGSDNYIVPEALTPVRIDWDKNEGLYIEPNVWMVHGRQ